VKSFRNIVVYPSQELLRHLSGGAFFRGGPDWPFFRTQIYARHCWKLLPRPVDSRPYPSDHLVETADRGVWCGPVSNHFGHMIADFGMRIMASSQLDMATPLVFSLWDTAGAEPPPFFWQIIDHFAIDRRRIMLVRRPTGFRRLDVVPQAERRFGGGPSRRHLEAMDAIASPAPPGDGDIACAFVSRARWPMGRFAGESYFDQAFAAAGMAVFHPEKVDLQTQLQFYRRARRLIFSEGSAVHALQLMGHIDAEIVVLARRPRSHMAAASLRPRARSVRYIQASRGVIYGLTASGRPQEPSGVSVLHESSFIAGLRSIGVDITPYWDWQRYNERRDVEIAAWTAHRLVSQKHPGERAMIANRLKALSLQHLTP